MSLSEDLMPQGPEPIVDQEHESIQQEAHSGHHGIAEEGTQSDHQNPSTGARNGRDHRPSTLKAKEEVGHHTENRDH